MGILTGYQYFRFKLVPVLPCLVLVNVCLNPAVEGASYAVGRLWDTAIGLAVGLAVNLLIFPYDNSKKIRQTMEGLDLSLIHISTPASPLLRLQRSVSDRPKVMR